MSITTTYSFKGLSNVSKDEIQKFIGELQSAIGETKPDILTPRIAYEYCYHVTKKRWLEVEDLILTDKEHAYLYAKTIIKGRWKEAEDFIMTDANCAYCYALYVIKGRWPEAEQYIKENHSTWNDYCNHFKI